MKTTSKENTTPKNRDQVKIDMVIEVFEKLTGYSIDQLIERNRKGETKIARHVMAYILHKIVGLNSQPSGAVIDRDHATVLHSCSFVKDLLESKIKSETRLVPFMEAINFDYNSRFLNMFDYKDAGQWLNYKGFPEDETFEISFQELKSIITRYRYSNPL